MEACVAEGWGATSGGHGIQALWTMVRDLDCYVQWEANWEFPVNKICIFKRFGWRTRKGRRIRGDPGGLLDSSSRRYRRWGKRQWWFIPVWLKKRWKKVNGFKKYFDERKNMVWGISEGDYQEWPRFLSWVTGVTKWVRATIELGQCEEAVYLGT